MWLILAKPEGFQTIFAGADAHDVVDWVDEKFADADLSGLRCVSDGLHRLLCVQSRAFFPSPALAILKFSSKLQFDILSRSRIDCPQTKTGVTSA